MCDCHVLLCLDCAPKGAYEVPAIAIITGHCKRWIARVGAGTIVGTLNHVLEINGGIGVGTGIICLGGDLDLRVGELLTTTAYNVVAGATLRMFVNEITGARIAAVGSIVNVTIAGFARQQITLVAGDETTNSGAFVRLGGGIFNLNGYPAGAVVTFNASCQADNAQTYEVQVFDVTAGAYLPGTITDNNAAPEVKSLGPLVLGAGQRIYEVHGRLTTGSGGGDFLRVPSALFDVSP